MSKLGFADLETSEDNDQDHQDRLFFHEYLLIPPPAASLGGNNKREL
jgi:hypothetical protein